MSALLLLRAVAAAGLLAVADALGVQRAADDLVADAGEVLHTAAAHEHHRVLLQVVADARDVGGDLDAAGEADASDLAQRRVRLLRRRRVDARAHATTLRGTLQRRGLGLLDLVLAALADQLVDRGHERPGSPTCGWAVLWNCSTDELGRARGAGPARPDPGHPEPSGPRGRACRPSRDRPTRRTGSVAPRDSAPPPTGRHLRDTAGRQAHREREQAQGTLGTADHDTRPVRAGQSRVPVRSRTWPRPCTDGDND